MARFRRPGIESRRVRAGLIRLLLLGDDPKYRLHEAGLRIGGASIPDALSLEGCRDLRDLCLFNCRFEVRPVFRSAGLANLNLTGSHLPGLVADGLEARGDVFLRVVTATGEVRLLGAKLGGDFDCTDATFRAEKDAEGNPGNALSADGLEAGVGVGLGGVTATGTVRLLGAKLGGGLDCDGATFRAETDAEDNPGNALSADGAEVKGALFLREGSSFAGVLSLVGAEFDAIIDLPHAGPAMAILCSTGVNMGRLRADRRMPKRGWHGLAGRSRRVLARSSGRSPMSSAPKCCGRWGMAARRARF